MMIKIEALTLEDAYLQATAKMGVSISSLECEVIQYPSKGFLGFGRKNAIIIASVVTLSQEISQRGDLSSCETSSCSPSYEGEDFSDIDAKIAFYTNEREEIHVKKTSSAPSFLGCDVAIDKSNQSFYTEKPSMVQVCDEITQKLEDLFSSSCFSLDPIEVFPYAENIIMIRFSGPDSALLIGKDGYRYKALSYMIFNWIHAQYGYFLRLEIAQFLQNQEDAVRKYLNTIVESITTSGRGQTKVLDGVLVQIALHELRKTFPDKNVVIKLTPDGERYVNVSPFLKKHEA